MPSPQHRRAPQNGVHSSDPANDDVTVSTTSAVAMAERGAAVALPVFGVRVSPPRLVRVGQRVRVHRDDVDLARLDGTEPMRADVCRRLDVGAGITEGCGARCCRCRAAPSWPR